MDVVVTGIGLTSAIGELSQTWKGLLEQRSGIYFHQPFLELEPKPLALIDKQPRSILPLTQAIVLDALKDADLEPPLVECSVVVGSSRGNQAVWEQLAAGKGERSEWLQTLPNVAAIATAQLIQSQAIVLSPMAACATGLWAIARGVELIQSGQCQRVIAGAVEAPITPLTLVGFELAKQRGAGIYGRVLGFGLTADGYHVSAPEPGSRAAIAAIQQCLERSRLTSRDVDYIHAHGTATRLNDQNEAHLIRQLFSSSIPVSSTKGLTGHTLGASGALGAAFCLMALKHQILPPNVGLRNSEFDLAIVRSAQLTTVENALCFSFGFGGQNAVIAFSRYIE